MYTVKGGRGGVAGRELMLIFGLILAVPGTYLLQQRDTARCHSKYWLWHRVSVQSPLCCLVKVKGFSVCTMSLSFISWPHIPWWPRLGTRVQAPGCCSAAVLQCVCMKYKPRRRTIRALRSFMFAKMLQNWGEIACPGSFSHVWALGAPCTGQILWKHKLRSSPKKCWYLYLHICYLLHTPHHTTNKPWPITIPGDEPHSRDCSRYVSSDPRPQINPRHPTCQLSGLRLRHPST